MTHHVTSETTARQMGVVGFPIGAWVRANAFGLGLAYGLLALFGGVAEALGADHSSLARDLAGLAGMLIGVGLFMAMRRRVLAPHIDGSAWLVLVAGIGMAVGFAVGFVVAGPPFDFLLGVIMLGTVGGALQWRLVKNQLAGPGGLLLAGIGAWLLAGVAAVTVAILAGDAIDAAFGSDIAGFVAVTVTIGLVGGAVGGAVEGAALRRRIPGTA